MVELAAEQADYLLHGFKQCVLGQFNAYPIAEIGDREPDQNGVCRPRPPAPGSLQQVFQLVKEELDNQTDNADLTQPRKAAKVVEKSNQFPRLYND